MNAERIKAILDFARDFFPDGEIDELQALALAGMKLPVNASGERITLGSNQYALVPDSDEVADIGVLSIGRPDAADGDDMSAWLLVRDGDGDEWETTSDKCYSTLESALVAQGDKA